MRGQAHTLEATVASLLMLSAVIFALQMTAVTPLSASTSSQHIENQQRATAEGVLATAADEGALKSAVLYWNDSGARFHDSMVDAEANYTGGSQYPDNRFGRLLDSTFIDRESSIAYNVNFQFGTSGPALKYIYSGQPSDNAVAATRTVSIYEDDHIYDADGSRNSTEVASSNYRDTLGFTDASDDLYTTVRVEVVVWQI